MTLILTGLSIYLFFAVVLAIYFVAYALSKGRTQLVLVFSLLCAAVTVYLFGYLLELNSTYLEQMIFWNRVQHLGVPFFPALWLLLCLLYSEMVLRPTPCLLVVIFFIPIATFLLVMTNHLHHLYYTTYQINIVQGLTTLHLSKGPWYWVHSFYLTVCLLITTVIYYRRSRQAPWAKRAGYQLMLLLSFIPYLGLVLILTNFGGGGIDYAALVIPLSLLCLLMAISRYDVLSIKALAWETIFQNNRDAMILIDSENGLIDYNHSATKLFNTLERVGYRQPIHHLFSEFGNGPHQINDLLRLEQPKDLELEIDGEIHYYDTKLSEILDADQQPIGRLLTFINVTLRKQSEEAVRRSEEKLRVLATTDELTGIPNRRRFMEQGRYELARSRRDQQTFCLFMMDIDHYKEINDTYGHGGGDAVLRHIGMFMKNHFRSTDFLGRVGGEEFGVILPNTSLEGAEHSAESFRKRIEQENINYQGKTISITFSIGICSSSPDLTDFEGMLRIADQALYQSKANGRNRTTALRYTG